MGSEAASPACRRRGRGFNARIHLRDRSRIVPSRSTPWSEWVSTHGPLRRGPWAVQGVLDPPRSRSQRTGPLSKPRAWRSTTSFNTQLPPRRDPRTWWRCGPRWRRRGFNTRVPSKRGPRARRRARTRSVSTHGSIWEIDPAVPAADSPFTPPSFNARIHLGDRPGQAAEGPPGERRDVIWHSL